MNTQSNTKILQEIKSYIIVSIGMLIYSFAWTAILIPSKVMGGGITGVSMLIYYSTGGDTGGIPVGISYFVMNFVLILIGFMIIGPRFGTKTIYAMLFNSVALTVLQEVVPMNLLGLASDKLLSAVLGGALCGMGVGICFGQGGSTGGTDIIAMIVNKYRNVSLGKVIMLCDVVIIGSSFFVFKDITSIIYGYITMAVLGYTIDMVLQGNRQSCQLMVISKKYNEICDRIVVEAHRGVTLLEGTGWYTKQPQKVIMVFCRKTDTHIIYRIIKEVDTNAFITNASVSGVYGEGFDNIKMLSTKKSPI